MAKSDYIKQLMAQKTFSILDTFNVIGIEEVGEETDDTDHIELWLAVKMQFTGEIPDSYRVFNAIIGDWVEGHTEQLDKAMFPTVMGYFESHYPEGDFSALKDGFNETPIWTDQADYMPRMKEGENSFIIEIELVFEMGDQDEEEDV